MMDTRRFRHCVVTSAIVRHLAARSARAADRRSFDTRVVLRHHHVVRGECSDAHRSRRCIRMRSTVARFLVRSKRRKRSRTHRRFRGSVRLPAGKSHPRQ
jgi:hypothetical protein